MNSFYLYGAGIPRARWALLATPILFLLGLWICMGPVSGAQADGAQAFCSSAWLDRYGQPNDSCAANDKHYNYKIQVYALEHSACASTTTNTSKSGVNWTWSCAPAWNWGVNWMNPTVLTNGIIRNNTVGDVNHASGYQFWCHTYNCTGG
jgi:hypothetical protein